MPLTYSAEREAELRPTVIDWVAEIWAEVDATRSKLQYAEAEIEMSKERLKRSEHKFAEEREAHKRTQAALLAVAKRASSELWDEIGDHHVTINPKGLLAQLDAAIAQRIAELEQNLQREREVSAALLKALKNLIVGLKITVSDSGGHHWSAGEVKTEALEEARAAIALVERPEALAEEKEQG